jgi:hypothetical protein
MSDSEQAADRGGVYHHHSDEELVRFRSLSPLEKLEWLEAMRRFLLRFQPAEQREIMNRFRRGEL